jgi:isopenicillin N synthase-like dioxygenase
MNISLERFVSEGVVSVVYPGELRGAVEKAVASWREFTLLPEAVKTKFPYIHVGGTGLGYELKKVSGARLDLKEDFHVAWGAREELKRAAKETGIPLALQLVEDALVMTSLMNPLVNNFGEEVEKKFLIDEFGKEVRESNDIAVVRFIHYFGGSKVGDEIAKAHADKSGFTLHLYESDSGLEYLDRSYAWQAMPVSQEETVVIPGMRGQYRSRGLLKATYHRVVATQATAQEGRYSAVAFIHLKDTPAYNKAGAGRLQEFDSGFNYEMPFGEFSRLFVA